mmetsp:Transcript_36609/g.41771  ORF Transcript_36609/g.41771 Transcript_36609/m.41771 type:complete len:280 (+) Transcript_36609:231-1070(+)|eukprot:CAMPEP_0194133472 /NCGR_PEP_ID=MMETSP0152-20130528/3632_1 /TAXON_ID=1049557 /ORGANISM="Thalassiothrix antarctica, Strain L6-D1" /LENGTH=279 /DNA_ID=CAMNT_0038828791 /DNA_START=212 /DNA_END=1051 /DNA_ORIENTATION=-
MNCSCLFSAFCFIVSNALGIAVIVEDKLRPSYSEIALRSLDPEYIQLSWNHRRNIAPLVQCSHVFNCLAWLFLLPPVLQLAWSLSRGGKRKVGIHTAIGGFAIAGCTTEILSRLLLLGGWGAAQWISTDFNLNYWIDSGDSLGWKTLEVVYIVMEGLLNWVDAFEWICLFTILILLYFSIGTQMPEQRAMSMGWARLGLMVAFLSFVDFSADLLRLEDWKTFAQFAIFISIVNTCILLPMWLLWLSCTIRNVLPNYDEIEENDPVWNNAGGTAPQIESF